MTPFEAHPLVPAAPRSWLHRRVLDPVLDLLKTGLSAEKLALTLSLGVAFGLVPLFGITTIISTIVALRLRLNVAAMQLAAHLMSVFQLALLIPLLRNGARLLGQSAQVEHLTVASLRQLITHDGWAAVGKLLWRAELGALVLWALGSMPLVVLLYFGLRVMFRRVLARQGEAAATEELG